MSCCLCVEMRIQTWLRQFLVMLQRGCARRGLGTHCHFAVVVVVVGAGGFELHGLIKLAVAVTAIAALQAIEAAPIRLQICVKCAVLRRRFVLLCRGLATAAAAGLALERIVTVEQLASDKLFNELAGRFGAQIGKEFSARIAEAARRSPMGGCCLLWLVILMGQAVALLLATALVRGCCLVRCCCCCLRQAIDLGAAQQTEHIVGLGAKGLLLAIAGLVSGTCQRQLHGLALKKR